MSLGSEFTCKKKKKKNLKALETLYVIAVLLLRIGTDIAIFARLNGSAFVLFLSLFGIDKVGIPGSVAPVDCVPPVLQGV